MSSASFPQAIAGWTDRVNGVDIVWAGDPNGAAAEIIAIETALGKMPQVETGVPVGNPVTYNSVSARITDTMLNTQHPYVELYSENFYCGYGSWNYGSFNTYRVVEDNWGHFNGSDITVRAPGVYLIDAYQTWDYFHQGYISIMLSINNTFARGHVWHWDDFPASGPHDASYQGRWATSDLTWMGRLNTGDRVRIASANNTNNDSYHVINSTLRMLYLRGLTPSQATSGPSTYPV